VQGTGVSASQARDREGERVNATSLGTKARVGCHDEGSQRAWRHAVAGLG
jgi:hypothetical protein